MDDEEYKDKQENVLTEEELAVMGDAALDSHDSSSFFADLAVNNPLENKKTTSIIETFVTAYQKKLTSFLHKKINIQFSSINISKLDDYHDKDKRMIWTSFAINEGVHYGLVVFDYPFLHTVINLLYGGQVNHQEPMIKNLGKSGHKIAEKFAHMSMSMFEQAMAEYGSVGLHLLKTAEQLGLVLNQSSSENHYQLSFQVSFYDLDTSLSFIIPCSFFDALTFNAPIDSHQEASTAMNMDFSELLQQELVESTVTLEAFLPSMSLKIKEAMNLKTGDLIPIGDPTMVELLLNQKKLFKALVGRANNRRVVKIIDRI